MIFVNFCYLFCVVGKKNTIFLTGRRPETCTDQDIGVNVPVQSFLHNKHQLHSVPQFCTKKKKIMDIVVCQLIKVKPRMEIEERDF